MNSPTSTTPDLDDIVDACLTDLLSGQATLDECIQRFPKHRAELKRALQIAVLTAKLKSPQLPEARIEALEQRLLAQAPARRRIIHVRFQPVLRLAAMLAIVFLALLGTGAGAVAASANAVPGDFLYGLKRLWEAIVLALTPLTGQADDLWLQFADARLDEIEELSARGQITPTALNDLHDALQQAALLADAETAAVVTAYTTELKTRLAPLRDVSNTMDLEENWDRIFSFTVPEPNRVENPSPMTASTPLPEAPTATAARPENTFTPSPTITLTPSATATQEPSSTPTPRVPATATRTPLPTTTPVPPTASLTPSATPSATWTPLPLPTRPNTTPVAGSTTAPTFVPDRRPSNTPDAQATLRLRETEQSVSLTQTAGPPATDAAGS